MLVFLARRLLQAIPVIFLASVMIFLLLRLVPGDPATLLAGQDASPEVVQAIRVANGLDRPLPVQYLVWVGNLLHGDFGRSIFNRAPVLDLIGQRAPATLELTLASTLVVIVIAFPTGIAAAVWQRRPAEWIISSVAAVVQGIPGFWLGILAIMLFSLALAWLPPGGMGDFNRDPVLALKLLLMPAITLALPFAFSLSRLIKSSMLEVLNEDYVRTAQAKGLIRGQVVLNHAMRNALIPIVTLLGLQFGRMLGGAIITESVFSWPGLGRLIRDAINTRDYAVVQAALLVLVLTYIVINLLTDLSYGLLDPRIRLGGRPGR
jgi:peptide/nickel transport system permease protein